MNRFRRLSRLAGRWPRVLFAVALLPGCVIRHGDFTVLSTKLVQTQDFDLTRADRKHDVRGEDVSHIICFIPTQMDVTLEAAIDDVLRKGQGDIVTDAVVHWWTWYIPLIYGQTGWSVEGDVVRTRTR